MDAAGDQDVRLKRVGRIKPFLHDLSSEKEPKTNKAVLLVLVQDLKDEGNCLFKEGKYSQASSHYKHAVFVASILESRYYHEVANDFLTTLHANGALSYLKTNKFTEALLSSSEALKLQPQNLKAQYRKVQALMGLQRYKEALKEAQDGMTKQPSVFKDCLSQIQETLAAQAKFPANTKSATASASTQAVSAQGDASNEWLAGTNALKTEKQRKAALEKMPKKKKPKNPQPVVSHKDESSDTDVDSDSTDPSDDNLFAAQFANVRQKGFASGVATPKKGGTYVQVSPKEPDFGADLLRQNMGFKTVGQPNSKQNGMGLDDFAHSGVGSSQRTRSHGTTAQRLPPVDIEWPLDDDYQFRVACKACFVKTGEGYKGYNLLPNYSHRCEKNFLVIRRREKQALNWIKIRPFPQLTNSRFAEFKMCQQFINANPCKIGEARCTFPHNSSEMKLWYMERDGSFSVTRFLQELSQHGIETSEQLAARRPASPLKPEPQQIPGLNYKGPSRPRLASPAPVEEHPARHVPPTMSHPPPQAVRLGRPGIATPSPPRAPPGFAVTSPPPPVNKSASFTSGSQPPGQRSSNPFSSPPLLSKPPPTAQASANPQPNIGGLVLPLKDYDVKIVCPKCFPYDGFPGRYRYMPFTHECEENVLAVKRRNVGSSFWVRVRERTNHRDFPGRYILCNSVLKNRKDDCRFGEASCSFAHNEAEQVLWGLEKDGRFSITDFILQSRTSSSFRGFTLGELLRKYPGFFTFVCRACFYDRPPRVSQGGPNNTCTGVVRHIWDQCKVLAHVDTVSDRLTLVDQRKFTSKSAFFRICKFLHFCQDQIQGVCLSAHSLLERDVWMLERDTDITRQQIVEHSQRKAAPPPTHPQQPQQPPPSGGMPRPAAQSQFAPPSQTAQSGKPGREKVPYTVQEYCGVCWRNGNKNVQDGSANRCVKRHPNFELNKVFLILPIFRELRNLPHTIPRSLNFVLCRYIQEKKKCQYAGSVPCQFAHSDEERVLWIWMARNKVSSLKEVVEACKQDQQKVKINQGDSVVAVTPARPPGQQTWMPSHFQNNSHYCRYCSIQCNSDRQWEVHCASEKHNFNVNSDRDHQWNFRQPPWGQGNNLDLCSKHMDGERCPYSHVPDMFNLCKYAHSAEELDEWRERYEWRQMKRTLARQQNMFSYMDTLLEEYNSADSRVTVMSESLDGVSVSCNGPLEVFKQEKNALITWTFLIKTKGQRSLGKVALLHHSARLHFHLQCADGSKHQIAAGEQFEDVDARGLACYSVNVHFSGGMFGSFSQWVAFDFGTKPVLLRKLNVELGHETVHEKVRDLRQMLAFDRWTTENREVIPFKYCYNQLIVDMQQKYKEPASSETVITQDSIRELNEHNYVHKMHRMLELEEITRHRLISSFNLVTEAEVVNQITEHKGTFFARSGELFMKLQLSENLTEDTSSGRLILTSVRSVLLASKQSNSRRVYEAVIFTDENFNYDGRGRDYIYLCLASSCVADLKLKAGQKIEIEVQFQLNRLHFLRMHYALDAMTSTDIVFPDVSRINFLSEQHVLKIQSRVLNEDQLQAVRHIVAEHTGYTPPFIMYGPFGTGKTETLAQAAMVLLREKPQSRILICAQSNSAADLYILKHLDPYLRKSQSNTPLLLRIVSKERRLPTVSDDVKKYCCLSADGQSFEIPSEDIVRQHRVVVTTVEMSLQLTSMNLRGFFTHIFIDEAAQALECETIMPLTLATNSTCVVLTGDHMQTSPRVYSAEARRQSFGMSLLERLYVYYEAYAHHLMEKSHHSPLNIFLSINYRTKMEILRFISAIFYGGPDLLKAHGNIPSVVEVTPLVFHAVQGREVQESDSTSYYNLAEATEVVEQVMDLIKHWPMEWGACAPEEIGIVTPYYDQVKQIRGILRSKRGLSDLRKVKVETVQNMQGKEFRALFISTVRTRHLLESDHLERALEEAEFMGGVADFAFLSDPKLLNTALTRTQAMVAVVGDPVALCAIGECIQIWRTYLKHCTNMNSVYPRHMSYDAVRNQVVHLQMSSVGERLKEVTDLFKNVNRMPRASPKRDLPSSRFFSGTRSSSSSSYTDHHVVRDVDKDSGYFPSPVPDPEVGTKVTDNFTPYKSAQELVPPSKGKVTKVFSVEERDTDFPIEPDEIMLQLARESLAIDNLTQLLKVECVTVKVENGVAVLSYDERLADENKRRKMLSAANAGKEFDSDVEIYSDVDEDSGSRQVFYNYGEDRLLELLQEDPGRYKLCTITINAQSCHASVLNPLDPIQEVKVLGCLRRGRAFDRDEVVVEILRSEEEGGDNGAVHGQVIGIMQRAVDSHYRSFVCSADADNTALLTPVNPGIPQIFNVSLQKHVQRVKKAYVSVYELSADRELQFSHYEKVDANDPEAKLFIVRYLKWLPGFYNPLGVVVGVMPAGRDLTSALHIVNVEHHIPKKFSADVDRELEELYQQKSHLPTDVQSTRENITDRWCFTMESSNAHDLQHAFSIDQLSDASYEVGVHISDVTYFVKQGTVLDREAMRRGTTILPIGHEPVHMLPENLSTDLCSLQSGADRVALSVFMTVAASGEEWHVTETSLRHTIINCKQHFTLAEVEKILSNVQSAESDYLHSCVLVLYQIGHMHRKQRKGNAHLDPELAPQHMTSPNAYRMLQELLVMANHQIAEQLVQAFPQSTPLLQQGAPNPRKLEAWKSKHAADAINSVALTRPFLSADKVCTCRMVCMCVFNYMREQEVKPLEHFDVLTELWKHLVSAAQLGHQDAVQKAVAAPDNHPQPSVALGELEAICQPWRLVCSDSLGPSQRGHYSLNLPCVTNATSPLRNYISIVVLRMVSALIQGRKCPYSSAEMVKLVGACNRSQNRADSFSAADTAVHVAAALQARPLVLFPVVEGFDEEKVCLRFPTMPYIPEKEKNVMLSSLGPATIPQVNKEADQAKLVWQERIYDSAYASENTPPSSSHLNEIVELCADRFVSHIPPFQWQKLLAAVREENAEKLQTIIPAMKDHVHDSLAEGRFAVDVSSEVRRSGLIQHFAEFSLSLHTCMVIQVQVAAEMSRGVLSPRLQLFSLTPRLDICLEHHDNPAQCFAKVTTLPATSSNYTDEASYQERWLPVLALEAAECSVRSQEFAIIHSVPIVWTREADDSIVGEICLPQTFCRERRILALTDSNCEGGLDLFGLRPKLPTPLDLLCVRYAGLQIADEPALDEQVSSMVNTGCSVCWVGHCVVLDAHLGKMGTVDVKLSLHSAAMKMPDILLDQSIASQLPCTVEWIPRTLPYRQMEYSLSCLRDSSELAKDIATGRRPVSNIEQSDVGFLLEKLSASLNPAQKAAIETSLKQPFTVIQGGPGTGKTVTAAHLAGLCVERNRMTPQPLHAGTARTQVLICGPSDQSLDAAAAHLRALGQSLPKVVRVYEEEVERLLFPIPRDTVPPRKKKLGCLSENPQLQNMALHHLIRRRDNQYSQQIEEFDSLFSLYPQDITDAQVEEYHGLVLQAELQELRQAEIVLATCSAAAAPKMAHGTNVRQIIIDDCGACKEVESLVPIILHKKALQVVIVGDEKQLQPTVRNATARSLGLERSLLERYADRAVTLQEQYRMHQGISGFPSAYYENKLVAVTKSQSRPADLDIWPASRAQPIAFCHLVGHEETVTMAEEDGLGQSVLNTKEVETVVSIVVGLVQGKGVGEERIAVVTQHSAQQQHIRQGLAQRNLQVLVNLVSDCQGHEYDYVLFSTTRSIPRSQMERMPTKDWMQRRLGCLADKHQVNVAITRARQGLIIIGNKHLLQCQPMWGSLLSHYRKTGKLLDAADFLRRIT